MDQAILAVHADMHFHAMELLVAFLGLMHLRIPLLLLILSPPAHSGFALVEVERGAAMTVVSMIVPCFIAMPLALWCSFTASKICSPRSF